VRAPVFLGLREDKKPREVILEAPSTSKVCVYGSVTPYALLEADRKSVRAFFLAYSNIKDRVKLFARMERGIDDCLCSSRAVI